MAEFKDELWTSSKRRNKGNNMYSRRPVFIVAFFLFFVNPLMAAPVDEFLGADMNKLLEIPKYLNICHRSDKKLDKCIKSSLNKLMKHIQSGGKELNLPTIDPVEIPTLKFQLGEKNVSLEVTFFELRIDGFNKFKVTNAKSNLIDNKFEISVDNPVLTMSSRFGAEGGIYTFPISAQGDFSLNLTDVSAVLIFRLTNKNLHPGLSFFAVENCLMDMVSSEINAHFGDSIDGSKNIGLYIISFSAGLSLNCSPLWFRYNNSWQLSNRAFTFSGTAFNTFFNNNAHEIFTLVKPKISDALAKVFGSIADEILSRHPDHVLLPD